MRRLATIAIAVAALALACQGGCVGEGEEVVEAIVAVGVLNGNATYVVTYDWNEFAGTEIHIAPDPMLFTYDNASGQWVTGTISAYLVISSEDPGVATLTTNITPPSGQASTLRAQGPLEFQFGPNQYGSVTLGPFPLSAPDLAACFGNETAEIIEIRPDIEDDEF